VCLELELEDPPRDTPFIISFQSSDIPSMLGQSDLGTTLPSFLQTSLSSPSAKVVLHEQPELELELEDSLELEDPPVVLELELEDSLELEDPPFIRSFKSSDIPSMLGQSDLGTTLPSFLQTSLSSPSAKVVLHEQLELEEELEEDSPVLEELLLEEELPPEVFFVTVLTEEVLEASVAIRSCRSTSIR